MKNNIFLAIVVGLSVFSVSATEEDSWLKNNIFTMKGVTNKKVISTLPTGSVIRNGQLLSPQPVEIEVTEKIVENPTKESKEDKYIETTSTHKAQDLLLKWSRSLTPEEFANLPDKIKTDSKKNAGVAIDEPLMITKDIHDKLTDAQKYVLLATGVIILGGVTYYYREPLKENVGDAINWTGNKIARVVHRVTSLLGFIFPEVPTKD